MKLFSCICACALVLTSCVTGEFSETVCKTSTMSVAADVPTSTIPGNEVGIILDLQEIISKLNEYGDVTVSVSSHNLRGDLSWATHVTVTMRSARKPDKYPEINIVNQDINPSLKENSLKTFASSEQLTKYFSQGEVELRFKFDYAPGNISPASHNICLNLDASTDKNLFQDNIMLLPNQIESFFKEHQIDLQMEKELSVDEVTNLFLSAGDLGYSFSAFALNAVINPTRNGIQTNFESWEELYTCYCFFMTAWSAKA